MVGPNIPLSIKKVAVDHDIRIETFKQVLKTFF